MPQIDTENNQIIYKIVYFGPALSGKTTNLEVIHQKTPAKYRSDLMCTSIFKARTLHFEFSPLELGTIDGMRLRKKDARGSR